MSVFVEEAGSTTAGTMNPLKEIYVSPDEN
jgi:hypothetical protein